MATMVCLQGEPWCAWHMHAKCLGKVGAEQGVQGVLRAHLVGDTCAKCTPGAAGHARALEALLTPRLQLSNTCV